jgi:hypothetical protein
MVDATTFVTELEGKHQESYRQVVAAYVAGLGKESMSVADALKLELRAVFEAIEVAALWLPDSDDLKMKVALATRCGESARHVQLISDRLVALGVPPESFDPRHGGYSKLFAFFRSLQTGEERAAAGFVTMGSLSQLRFEAMGQFCEEKGDPDTATLYRGPLAEDERRHVSAGRQLLIAAAETEESQARARRSTYRTIELVGEIQDVSLLRKFLLRSKRS